MRRLEGPQKNAERREEEKREGSEVKEEGRKDSQLQPSQ